MRVSAESELPVLSITVYSCCHFIGGLFTIDNQWRLCIFQVHSLFLALMNHLFSISVERSFSVLKHFQCLKTENLTFFVFLVGRAVESPLILDSKVSFISSPCT